MFKSFILITNFLTGVQSSKKCWESEMFIPDSGSGISIAGFSVPDPGSKKHRIPDPDPQYVVLSCLIQNWLYSPHTREDGLYVRKPFSFLSTPVSQKCAKPYILRLEDGSGGLLKKLAYYLSGGLFFIKYVKVTQPIRRNISLQTFLPIIKGYDKILY